jgi:hypothetical protein
MVTKPDRLGGAARYEMEVARDAFEGRIAKEIQPRESKAA